MLAEALRYAHAGYSVIPVQPRGKTPLCEHGSKDSTTDEAIIRAWWDKWPDANIGLTLENLVVIDIDPRNGGDVENLPHKLPDTCYALTGGKGWHYAYHVANGAKFPSSLGPGIDVKSGRGAYIVVEPSIHPSGEKYVWLDESELWAVKPAEAPDWLSEPQAQPEQHSKHSRAVDWLDSIRAGNALHDSTRDLAAHYVSMGMGFSEVCKLLEIALHSSMAPRDERWNERFNSIAYQVNTAIQKFAAKPAHGEIFVDIAPFIGSITPPQWLIDGIIQRSYLYGLTALTNHGKTALAALMAVCIAMGRDFNNQQCESGHVLFMAGENPEDFKLRLKGTIQALGIPLADIAKRVTVMPFVDKLVSFHDEILAYSARQPLAAIFVDTNTAYFSYMEENANVDNAAQAKDLRRLVKCNGAPAVIPLCHPVKNAAKDNLVPRGGGAFMNELDCNLTLWKEAEVFELDHNKLRGPPFQPMQFRLDPVMLPGVLDSKGRTVSTIVAAPMSELAAKLSHEREYSDAELALAAIKTLGNPSLSAIAAHCEWILPSGQPAKAKAQRAVKILTIEKCLTSEMGKLKVTEKGKKRLF